MFVTKCLVGRINTAKIFSVPFLKSTSNFSNSSGILNSELSDVDIPRCSLHEYLFENIGKWENHTAVKCAVTGRKYTFKEVEMKSKNVGTNLRKKLKLNRGDVVTILSPNVPEFVIAALGITRGELICTTVNPLYTPEEISRQLSDCSAKAIITLTDLWPLAKATRDSLKKDIPIITFNSQQSQSTPTGAITFNEFADNNCDLDVSISTEDVAFLPYSSGTTGLPKGVQLSHRNVIANLCQLGHPEVAANLETTSQHQDITPAVLPMFHIYGLNGLCCYQLRLGCQVVTLPKFTPELYIKVLKTEKPDVLFVAPPIAMFLAHHPAVTSEDLESVRHFVNGAALMGARDQENLLKKVGRTIPILQAYGMTEASPGITSVRESFLSRKSAIGSIGKLLPNTEAKVVAVDDQTGTPLGPNEMGELLVRGPQVMKGYYNRPNENVFLDGWLKTGDMVYYNNDGFLFIADRLKELIKVKGFQVAPAELEEIIRTFPNVTEAAVIGVPHDTLGEVPRAYIVAQPSTTIDCDKLLSYVAEKVAPYKSLAGGISVIDNIPKNAAGKILRKDLKSKYQSLGI